MSIRRFFWHCAGANVQILEGCATDHSRYVNIGATILMTALLAWVSMGFALYSIFASVTAAVAAGFVWACMIFVLDRTIVTSMRKPSKVNIKAQNGASAYGNAKNPIGKAWDGMREFLFLLIRFLVAILVAVVITKPLEVKIFEGRLGTELENMKARQFEEKDKDRPANESGIPTIEKSLVILKENEKSLNERIANNEKSAEFQKLETELAERDALITPERNQRYQDIRFYQGLIADKRDNEVWLGSPLGQRSMIEWKQNITNANAKIEALEAPGREIQRKMKAEKERYDLVLKNEHDVLLENIRNRNVDLLRATNQSIVQGKSLESIRNRSFDNSIIPQIEALESLKAHDSAIWWTSTFIMLLFITVELAPVLAKLLSKRGEYDDAIEAHEVQRWLVIQTETALKINEMNALGEVSNAKLEAERRSLEQAQKDLQADHESARNAKVELDTKKQAAAIEKELASYSELVEKIAAAQREIALVQVEIWKKEQLEKLNGKP
ncbi:MAG: hypothetical protein RLZZ519_3136 [Bacteroidota bacterium]|jgi:hypothetical protein